MERARSAMAEAIAALTEALHEDAVSSAGGADLLGFALEVGALLRTTQAALIMTTAEADQRSSSTGDRRFDIACGCRNVNELMQRATGAAPTTIKQWSRLGSLVREDLAMTGERRAARFPALRQALFAGRIGADGLAAAAVPLEAIRDRIPADHLAAADQALADVAATDDDDLVLTEHAAATAGDWGAPAPDATESHTRRSTPAMTDTLRVHASAWAAALDQDGAMPQDERAQRMRSLYLGTMRDGLVPLQGRLSAEVALQLQTIIDAINNPHGKEAGVRFRDSDDEPMRDERTTAQRAHDALATALGVAAASDLPVLGGSAPTVVVHVTEDALSTGTGWARVTGADATGGDLHVPVSVATHTACIGQIQRVVTGSDGRVLAMTIIDRAFNAHQRRAITLRDSTCVIPGCHTPARWCEVHHVTEWHDGGTTSIDNGVLLCWNHHRFIDSNGWAIRMAGGVPEVRAPHWIDPTGRWRSTRPPAPAISPG